MHAGNILVLFHGAPSSAPRSHSVSTIFFLHNEGSATFMCAILKIHFIRKGLIMYNVSTPSPPLCLCTRLGCLPSHKDSHSALPLDDSRISPSITLQVYPYCTVGHNLGLFLSGLYNILLLVYSTYWSLGFWSKS